MTAIVIDASITASWLLPDEASDFAAELYDSRDKIELHVPSLWNYEIRNILVSVNGAGESQWKRWMPL